VQTVVKNKCLTAGYIIIVIVNLRFLQYTQKRSRGNQLIHRCLSKTKSIGSWSDPQSQAGRQTVRRLWWMVFGVIDVKNVEPKNKKR